MKRALFFSFLIISIISCVKDEVPPVITSVNLQMNDTLRNIASIRLEATDNTGIHRIELFVNDSLIDQKNEIPYSYELNTLKLKDGDYEIRLFVYDSAGNLTKTESQVVIKNCLLILNAGSLYNDLYSVIVSDAEGNVLKYAPFTKNTVLSIMPEKPFEGEAINFLICRNSSIFSSITGYINVRRGSEYKIDLSYNPGTSKGVKVHLKNDITSFSRIVMSTDRGSYTILSMADTISLPQLIPYTTDHKLLIQVWREEGKFYRIIDINDATEMTVNLSSITSAMEKSTISFSSIGSASYVIQGRAGKEDIYNLYNINTGNLGYLQTSMDLWYPPEYFSVYHTYLSYSQQNSKKFYSNKYSGTIPAGFEFLDADATIVQQAADNFKINLQGIFDCYVMEYSNTDKSVGMVVFSTRTCSSWKLPNPGVLLNIEKFNFSHFSPKSIVMTNFSDVDFNSFYNVSLDAEKQNLIDSHLGSLHISF